MYTDAGSEEFSVEVHHGGFFVGHGHLRSYVNGKVAWKFEGVLAVTCEDSCRWP